MEINSKFTKTGQLTRLINSNIRIYKTKFIVIFAIMNILKYSLKYYI